MIAVELENVSKTFGTVRAVDNLSLQVPQGSIYGFIGPNGSGKTTTLRMIMNIFYPDCGVIRVLGREVVGARTVDVGYLPEERGLYKRMKVRTLLRFYGELKCGRNVNTEVDAWLDRLELGEWGNKKVEALSKGMSQKVQFIAAVVTRPKLAILDEPFSGLDPVNADALRDAMLELRRQGTTIILSTHDMGIAERMCDFIFMIFKGRKVLDGTLAAIQNQYGSDTIRVRTSEGMAALRGIAGVANINDHGQMQELHMERGSNSQQILAALMARTRVESFELTKPSLHDIFVRIAGPQAREVNRA